MACPMMLSLRPFIPLGNIHTVKMDVYQGVYVGVPNVLMDISTPIPSSLNIADHWCNIFYPRQVATCFACHESGHTRANCPAALHNRLAPAVDAAAVADPVLLPTAWEDILQEVVGSIVARVAAAPADIHLSYAAAVATDRAAVVTSKDDLQITDDGHAGLPLNHDSPTSTSGVLKITSVDLVDPLANNDGHHSVSVAAATDRQFSDLGQTSSSTVDPPPISVILGASKPPDDGQIDQRIMDVSPQLDDDSLSSTSTSDIKGEDSHDVDDDDNTAVDVINDPDVTVADEHFEDAKKCLILMSPPRGVILLVLAQMKVLCGSVAKLLGLDYSIWSWLFPSPLMMMKPTIRL